MWPFDSRYLRKPSFPQSQKLKLAITAGVDSDHVDLQAAIDRKITVAEMTYSKSISVSEHVVMTDSCQFYSLLPVGGEGGWNIADCVASPTMSGARTSARLRGPHRPWRTPPIETLRHASSLST